jgi:hypothetical protein
LQSAEEGRSKNEMDKTRNYGSVRYPGCNKNLPKLFCKGGDSERNWRLDRAKTTKFEGDRAVQRSHPGKRVGSEIRVGFVTNISVK